ncbi:MAG: alpha/beta fold hydrolase [Myxococcota bacterium]
MSAAESPHLEPADPSAFDLRPSAEVANGAAALCLHGLTGTPYEMRPLAEALAARGVRARGPWMAGHEGGASVLATTSQEDWVDLARAELAKLRAEHDRVFLVGLSMGGLVSLRLAQTERVEALVVIGTPLVLAPPIPQLLPLIRLWISSRPKTGSDIREPAARVRHPGLEAMPLAAVAELIKLQAEVIPGLGQIKEPILIAHGRLDRTARPRDAERLHREIASAEKEIFFLERSGHVVTVDYDGAVLALAVADFLGRR